MRGLSGNIEVRSVVDRFLEHSRVYYFQNGGQEELFLSSADFMPRNLDRRLEIMWPVRDDVARQRLVAVLRTLFSDNQSAWRLLPDGRYERIGPGRAEAKVRSQERLMDEARLRGEASRVRRLAVFRPVGPGLAPGGR